MRLVKYACSLLVFSALTASAATLNFESGDGLNEWNGAHLPNYVIDHLHNQWSYDPLFGSWVSNADTGFQGQYPPVDFVNPYATFTEMFFLPDANYAGIIGVWADDTARVFLNDVLIQEPSTTLGLYCSIGPVGCLPSTGGYYFVNSSHFRAGWNSLVLEGFQLGGDAAGVRYYAALDPEPAPEPGTFALLGLGLAGLTLFSLRRR